jgi:hypothetical protein
MSHDDSESEDVHAIPIKHAVYNPVIPLPVFDIYNSNDSEHFNSHRIPVKKKSQINKRTLSYDEIMKLIDYIFISNFWDKKIGHAFLVDENQIIKWQKYFIGAQIINIPHCKDHHYNHYWNDGEGDVSEFINDIDGIIFKSYRLIYDILKLGNGKISLCGGALSNLILDGNNYSDWDIFFHGVSTDEADVLLLSCLKLIEEYDTTPDKNIIHNRNQRVHSVNVSYNMKIQFIKRIYKMKDQVLLGFDLAPSRIGYNPYDGLYATICGGMSIAMRCYPIDLTQRSTSFGYRLEKYVNKGFGILYPGVPLNFNRNIVTPDGLIKCRADNVYKLSSDFKDEKESDYDASHFNWIHILNEEYHLVTLSGKLDEMFEITHETIRKCITVHRLFNKQRRGIKKIDMESDKHFLGEKYSEYVIAVMMENDLEKGLKIWNDRCNWYVNKAIEYADTFIKQSWKTENPGSQSFGKYNPVVEDPREWYGKEIYQPVEVGIKHNKMQAFRDCIKNVSYMMNINYDIFRLICYYWLEEEVKIARDYLL